MTQHYPSSSHLVEASYPTKLLSSEDQTVHLLLLRFIFSYGSHSSEILLGIFKLHWLQPEHMHKCFFFLKWEPTLALPCHLIAYWYDKMFHSLSQVFNVVYFIFNFYSNNRLGRKTYYHIRRYLIAVLLFKVSLKQASCCLWETVSWMV